MVILSMNYVIQTFLNDYEFYFIFY